MRNSQVEGKKRRRVSFLLLFFSLIFDSYVITVSWKPMNNG